MDGCAQIQNARSADFLGQFFFQKSKGTDLEILSTKNLYTAFLGSKMGIEQVLKVTENAHFVFSKFFRSTVRSLRSLRIQVTRSADFLSSDFSKK